MSDTSSIKSYFDQKPGVYQEIEIDSQESEDLIKKYFDQINWEHSLPVFTEADLSHPVYMIFDTATKVLYRFRMPMVICLAAERCFLEPDLFQFIFSPDPFSTLGPPLSFYLKGTLRQISEYALNEYATSLKPIKFDDFFEAAKFEEMERNELTNGLEARIVAYNRAFYKDDTLQRINGPINFNTMDCFAKLRQIRIRKGEVEYPPDFRYKLSSN